MSACTGSSSHVPGGAFQPRQGTISVSQLVLPQLSGLTKSVFRWFKSSTIRTEDFSPVFMTSNALSQPAHAVGLSAGKPQANFGVSDHERMSPTTSPPVTTLDPRVVLHDIQSQVKELQRRVHTTADLLKLKDRLQTIVKYADHYYLVLNAV